MNGWIVVFASTSAISGSLATGPAALTASGLFALLSVLGVFTRYLRGWA